MRLTLQTKLALLALSVTLTASLVVVGSSFLQMRAREEHAALERLSAQGELYGEQVTASFRTIEADAEVLAQMAPIDGIIRAVQAGGGIDPLDGVSGGIWASRLDAIFVALLSRRPAYTQVRFIGRADNWRELARVNFGAQGPEIVADDDLQSKGQEPYLADGALLERGASRFSAVTYNREHGQVVGPPTIRFVRPVMDDLGKLFGVVVINADFEKLLGEARLSQIPDIRVAAVTAAGDYFLWAGGKPMTGLMFHDDADYRMPDWLAETIAGDGRQVTNHGAVRMVAAYSPQSGSRFGLNVIALVPRDVLFAGARDALFRNLCISLALSTFATVIVAALGRRMTRPLQDLSNALRRRADDAALLGQLPDSNDEIGDLASAFRDMGNDLIRARVRAEAVFNGAADGIVTISDGGIIEEVNPAIEALFLYRAEELVGQPVSVLMPPEFGTNHQGYVDKAPMESGRRVMAANRDIYGLRSDGSQLPLEISVSRADYSGRTHFIGILRDITARKEAELRTKNLLAALERSNGELDKFAYVASHDLKAPLRVIDNASRWLEEDLADQLDEDTRETMAMLRSRVERMERLLDDLLEHSRIGRVSEKAPMVSGAALESDIRALVDIRPGFTFEVSDAFRNIRVLRMPILTVLLNLVSNAFKHHDRKSGCVRLDVQERHDAFEFSIEDDGPGIPPAYHRKVFEIFQTLKPRDEVEGSGMGLAMVLKHVQVVGGSVTLLSDGGRGTIFRVVWPRDLALQREKAA